MPRSQVPWRLVVSLLAFAVVVLKLGAAEDGVPRTRVTLHIDGMV